MSSDSHQIRSIKTLSIGGATFDLFLNLNKDMMHDCQGVKSFSFPLGAKIGVHDVIGACGGGAHNTAVGLSRLGCKAAFSGVLGDDQWGQEIQRNMEREHIDMSFLAVIEHEPSSFSLILQSPTGERTILTHKSMDRHFHDVTFDREAASSMHAVYLNHIHEDTCVIENDIVAALAATPSTFLTWNPGGCQIGTGIKSGNKALLAVTDLLLLNKEEALSFTSAKTIEEALKLLIASGCSTVCITDGRNGATGTDGTTVYHCPSIPCDVVDSTGAGDAFGCAMTWALLSAKDLPTALKAGTMNATSVVGSIGAQSGLLTDIQIETKLKETSLVVTATPL